MPKEKAFEIAKTVVPMLVTIATFLVGGAYGLATLQSEIRRNNETNVRQDRTLDDHELRIRANEKHVSREG
jgi:hypothetical protein